MTCGVQCYMQERARGAHGRRYCTYGSTVTAVCLIQVTLDFFRKKERVSHLAPSLPQRPPLSLSLSLSLALSLSLFYQLLAALRFTCRFTCRFICRCPARSRSLLLPFLPRLLLSLRQRAASCERRAAPSLLPLLLLHAAFGRCFEGPAEQALQGALRQPERGDHLLFRRWHTRSIHGAASQRG